MILFHLRMSSFIGVLAVLMFSLAIQTTNSHSHGEETEDHSEFEQTILLGDSEDEYNKLNNTEKAKRLRILAEKMDEDKNGTITKKELLKWITKNHIQYIIKKSRANFVGTDYNEDGFVTLEEYETLQYDHERAPTHYKNVTIYKHEVRRFEYADRNKDGKLTLKEFVYFLHPEEGRHMIECIVEESIDNMDRDGDRLISVKDYIGDAILDMNRDEFLRKVKIFKDELDKDLNGVLDKEEMTKWISGGHRTTADTEAQHLLEHGDKDKDGQLSYDEVVSMDNYWDTSKATQYGDVLDNIKPTKTEL